MGYTPLPLPVSFFYMLQRAGHLDQAVNMDVVGVEIQAYLQRRWLVPVGYQTHVLAPVGDDGYEVEVEIDEETGTYRYHCPGTPYCAIEPLESIALYTIALDLWLEEMADWIGIEPGRRSRRPCCLDQHLWHLGDVRLPRTHRFVPLFVARAIKHRLHARLITALSDPWWPGGGVVLCATSPMDPPCLPRGHVFYDIDAFVCQQRFDNAALERVLHGDERAVDLQQPEQFLRGTLLKLPHFAQARTLSDERARIVRQLWGAEHLPPPEMTWAEVNRLVNTGYQSFDNAFGGKASREEVIRRVQYGRYQLRRHPSATVPKA